MSVIKRLCQSVTQSLILLLDEQFREEGMMKVSTARISMRVLSTLEVMEKSDQLTLFVAMDNNDQVIGYICIQWLQELWSDFPEAFISNFYVKSSSRRKGIGSDLLNTAIREAKQRKCPRIFLENNRENTIYATRFYSKRGWIERKDISIFEYIACMLHRFE